MNWREELKEGQQVILIDSQNKKMFANVDRVTAKTIVVKSQSYSKLTVQFMKDSGRERGSSGKWHAWHVQQCTEENGIKVAQEIAARNLKIRTRRAVKALEQLANDSGYDEKMVSDLEVVVDRFKESCNG